MFEEKYASLLALTGVKSNSEFARIMGCQRSYVSMLRNGKRVPAPGSRSAARLCGAICAAAEQKGALAALREAVNAPEGASEETLERAVERALLGRAPEQPEKEGGKRGRRPAHSRSETLRMGRRLDAAMRLTGVSNSALARHSGLDASMISRYRQGERFPASEGRISRLLSGALYAIAAERKSLPALSALTELPEDLLADGDAGAAAFHSWLLFADTEDALLDRFLSALDGLLPGPPPQETLLPPAEAAGSAPEDTCVEYRGIAGLQRAVLRFLAGAARRGVEELWLYSDQPTDWMTSGPSFALRWSSLMAECIRGGIRIRIVHNIDRGLEEMLDAIRNWLPLYMSGRIESWYCPRPGGERFCRTVFLAPGFACIQGSFPAGFEKRASYWYETEEAVLASRKREFQALLSACRPLVRIAEKGESGALPRKSRNAEVLLPAFSLATMPEVLLLEMADRNGLGGAARDALLREWTAERDGFSRRLAEGTVHELFPLPSVSELREGRVPVDTAAARLHYTREDYARHAGEVLALLEREKGYRVTLLRDYPFLNTKLTVSGRMVSVTRLTPPAMSFTVQHGLMYAAFVSYLERLRLRSAPEQARLRESLVRLAAGED